MLTLAAYMRGAEELSISADATISAGNAFVWLITANATGKKIKLESPSNWIYRRGGLVLLVINSGATPNSFSLCTSDGVVLATVAAGQCAFVSLADLDGVGTWVVRVA